MERRTDGDTPPDRRRVARKRARILATNPEMLHYGILPHHPNWSEFFGEFISVHEAQEGYFNLLELSLR